MNQQTSILNITKYLGRFVHEVKANNAISLFDINKIAENVVIPIFREIFDCHELDNLNLEQANMPGIDLGDKTKRLSFQITSTAGNHKIKHTLEKFTKYKLHEHFDTLYIYILTEKQSSYADGDYLQLLENRIAFDTKQHILDYKDLLNRIDAIRDYAKIKRIEALLEAQFRDEVPGPSKIPHALTPPPFLPEAFIGREKQLEDIHRKLFSGDNLLLLVNGDGGMGKTSLASKYYYQYAADYAHVAFVFSERGIADALLALAVPLGLRFDEQADTTQRLEALLAEMANLRKPCLLVIDNANDTADLHANYQRLRRCPNFHLLLTTRITEFAQAATLRIEGLPDAQALDLFRKNYPLLRPDEEALFYQIREAVGNNTLVLELLSKNLTNFNNALRTRYALADLLADLQEKGLLQLTQTAAVHTDYQSQQGTMRHEKPEAIIAAMYDLGALPPDEAALLSNFAVLPAEAIDFATLETLLPDTPNLDTHLLALAQSGWIEYNEAATTFKCSPVIQEVTKTKNADRLLKDCKSLINSLLKALGREIIHLDNYQQAAKCARYGESILVALTSPDNLLDILCDRMGYYYQEVGNLSKALSIYERELLLVEKLIAEDPQSEDLKNSMATTVSWLGTVYTALGNLDKALTFFEERSRLGHELYAAYPQNVEFKNGLAVSYAKLAQTALANRDPSAARQYFQQAEALWVALVRAAPQYVQFQRFLGQVREDLAELE